jgi:hypothetical protein
MNQIDITFYEDEAKKYLKAWGFELTKHKYRACHSVYHNDVECSDEEGVAVRKEGTKSVLPTQDNNPVLEVFEREFRKRLFEKLT